LPYSCIVEEINKNYKTMGIKFNYMKKISFLFVILIACTVLKVRAQLTYGVKAGINYSDFVGNLDDVDSRVLPRVGGIVNYDFTNWLAVQSGIEYSAKGGTISGDNDREEKFILHYLEVPLNGVFSTRIGQGRIHAYFGPYLGYCLSAKQKYKEYTSGESSESVNIGKSGNKPYPYVERFDLGYNLGVGYKIHNWQLQCGYGGSFSTAFYYAKKENGRNKYFSATLAYFFDFKKKETKE